MVVVVVVVVVSVVVVVVVVVVAVVVVVEVVVGQIAFSDEMTGNLAFVTAAVNSQRDDPCLLQMSEKRIDRSIFFES